MPTATLIAHNALARHITGFPTAFREAWTRAQAFACELPEEPAAIVFAGMGGSASAGELTVALSASHRSPMPIVSISSYHLPGWVSPADLIIASSYSGNTEETLAAFDQALRAGAHAAAVTSGGELLARADRHNTPVFHITYDSPPRHGLAWTLPPLLAAARHSGALPHLAEEVEDAATFLQHALDDPGFFDMARRIAKACAGRVTVFYGAEHLAPVARRWKNQCNENAKHLAFSDELPGGNHNSIMGLDFPPAVPLTVVVLDSGRYEDRLRARVEASREVMSGPAVDFLTIPAAGHSFLAESLWAALLGDAVSLWLSAENGVDPLPIHRIEALKRRIGRPRI